MALQRKKLQRLGLKPDGQTQDKDGRFVMDFIQGKVRIKCNSSFFQIERGLRVGTLVTKSIFSLIH